MLIETDVIGKYVDRLLSLGPPSSSSPEHTQGITKDFLLMNGF